ncbi:MAG: SEC-C domain-containing protein [Phycisphaeraceae bacterium]|nr:SEC-C domain-containing protein [Phycisphaeraceae bacterium]
MDDSNASTGNEGGVTPSERYLAKLCRRSFLRLWSYPNLYRNQGNARGGDGKEICDLVALYGNTVVLFSDKSCAFKDSGRLDIDWNRWFKRAIQKSVDQLYGAERWLKDEPNRVFIDRQCTTRLPLALPPREQMRVHRICVALGAKQKCRELFGGSGSLPQLLPTTPKQGTPLVSLPFTIMQADYGSGIVHVFDDVTLDIVLGELDTIADFSEYLQRKEALLDRGVLSGVAGEEDLLALHLRHRASDSGDGFGLPQDAKSVIVTEGLWDDLVKSSQFRARKALDRFSYLWDEIIDTVAGDALGQKLMIPQSVSDVEQALRVMASESRFWRRVLSRHLLDFVATSPPNRIGRRVLVATEQRPTTYVFGCFPPDKVRDIESYKYRAWHMYHYCLAIAARHPRPLQVVGIGTEAGAGNGGRTYDLVMVRINNWTPELEKEASDAREELRVLEPSNVTWRQSHDDEYPPLPPTRSKGARSRKPGRNEPCVCGSGRKYKKCCGQ